MQVRALETLGLSVSKLIELRFVRSAHPGLDWLLSHDATTVLKQLTAEVSHDLRVPLAAVVASLEMLEDHLGDGVDPMTHGPAPAVAVLGRTDEPDAGAPPDRGHLARRQPTPPRPT